VSGVEAFTIMAILEAKDRISGVLTHVDETLDSFSSTAARAADTARVAGAAIDESFLQTASGADALEVANARLSASQASLAQTTQEQAAAERELLAAQAEAAAGTNDQAAADARLIAANERLATSQRAVATATADVAAAQRTQAATADASVASTTAGAAATGRFGGAAAVAGTALRTMGKVAIGAGIAAAAIGYESIKAATSYQTLTTRLVTSAGESAKNLKMIQQGVLGVSTATGTSANALATAMYQVESAGYQGAAGLTVLRAAAEGAKDEGADATTVAKGLTTALVNYHLPASAAAKVTSQLVTAVSHGKTTFQEFSASLASVLPIAANAHLKLADVTSVLATMTNHGFTAQRATSNMANAIRHLTAFTSVQTKEFAAMGISADQVKSHLSTEGLGGTLIWLDGIAKRNTGSQADMVAALGKLTGSASGANVAMSLAGKGADQYRSALKDVSGATTEAGGHVKGFGEIQKTFGFQMDKARAAIHNAGIAIGSALLPAVTRVATVIARVVTPIAGWVEKHQKLTAIVLGSLVALGALAAVIWVVNVALGVLLSPIGLIVAGIAAVVAIVIYAYNHFAAFRAVVNQLGTVLKTVFVEGWRAAAAVIQWFSSNVMPMVKKAIDALFAWFGAHKQQFVDAWSKLVQGVRGAAEWLNSNVLQWIRDRITDLTSWWRSHSAEIKEVWRALWEAVKTDAKVVWDGFLKPSLTILAGAFKTAWGLITGIVKTAWALISGVVTTAMHLVLNTIGVVLDVITGHWSKAWKDLRKLASDQLHDVASTIKNVTSNFGSLLYNAGRNVVTGLINGIKSMVGGVGSAIGDVVSEVKNHLPWSPAKKGPLSGSGAPEIGGRNIVKLMAQGILTGAPQVEAAMRHVTAVVAARQGVTANQLAVSAAAGGFAGPVGGAGGSVTNLNFDFRGTQVMSDRDIGLLVDKIGRQIATRVLPAAGVRIRM
jgi:TP901 family phage tail tape measure protein